MQNFSFTAEKKNGGTHAVYSAVFRLCAVRSGVYSVIRLFCIQGVFCACFGIEKIYSLFLYSAVIYTQVGLILWV